MLRSAPRAIDIRQPLGTVVAGSGKHTLVTVTIQGTPYVIVDIGLRMLKPRELYRAQGFPDTYVIDHGHDGRRFTAIARANHVEQLHAQKPANQRISAQYAAHSAREAS